MPRATLKKLLEAIQKPSQDTNTSNSNGDCAEHNPFIGIGLDSCVKATRFGTLLVQTTDFFYPLIDDPYKMGEIAAANVLSDLYAEGVVHCDNMLMLLGTSKDFTANERDVVIPLIIEGFRDKAREGGTEVLGGQTVINPWVIIGGVATAVVEKSEVIMPDRAADGDVLVVTKPLGTQVIVNAYQWMLEDNDFWKKIEAKNITKQDVLAAYHKAIRSMTCLNLNAAKLMHEFNAHAATDITGFGVMGHAENLANAQKNTVRFAFDSLPILRYMREIEEICGNLFGLMRGVSAETSGGLLIAFKREDGEKFCEKMMKNYGQECWIVGRVEKSGEAEVVFSKTLSVINV